MKHPYLQSWTAMELHRTKCDPEVQNILKQPLPSPPKDSSTKPCGYQSPCTPTHFPSTFYLTHIARQGTGVVISLVLEYEDEDDEEGCGYTFLVTPSASLPNYLTFSIENRDWLTCITFLLRDDISRLFSSSFHSASRIN